MPPSGGIAVFAIGFSTAAVEACRQSLWTSRLPCFPVSDLLRVDDGLSRAILRIPVASRAVGTAVFHSCCVRVLYNAVDNTKVDLCRQSLATRCRNFAQWHRVCAEFSTAIVEHDG
jgi:hypothetical protein